MAHIVQWLTTFVFVLLSLRTPTVVNGVNLQGFLHNYKDLSGFFRLLNSSPYLKSVMTWKEGTLLVPTNEAIFAYRTQRKEFNNMTLLYHFSNLPTRLSEFETSISTELPGYSPIWVTNTTDGRGIFLNDARYTTGNLEVELEGGLTQVVHIIDRVLEPTVPNAASTETSYLTNPDAGTYLDHASTYTNSENQITSIFSRLVSKAGRREQFSFHGFNTFFMPVDTALENIQDKIDATVIDAHIIHGRGIFLRPVELGVSYPTYRVDGTQGVIDNSTITVSFEKQRGLDGSELWLVQSENPKGDKNHRKGVVQAEIIKGNIPVKNGVVHLLSKALVVIDTDVFKTLEWYADGHVGSMKKFFDVVQYLINRDREYAREIRSLLEGQGSGSGITLFVPSNRAIEASRDLQMSKTNDTALLEIVKTHILNEPISADDIVNGTRNKGIPYQVETMLTGRKMLFSSVETHDGNRAVHLEGSGVNATILSQDFGATNGFIHIIDRVLGIPDQTILDKLKSHPMLQSTYHLWRKFDFERRFNATHYPLTFFAPSEMAWHNMRKVSPTAFQNLFEGDSLDLIKALERHLILERELTITELQRLSLKNWNVTQPKDTNQTEEIDYEYPVKALNGYLKVNVSRTKLEHPTQFSQSSTAPTARPSSNEAHYYVYFGKLRAHVIRPNVKCTNGYLHIIDEVLMDREEVLVASAPQMMNNHYLFLIVAFLESMSTFLLL